MLTPTPPHPNNNQPQGPALQACYEPQLAAEGYTLQRFPHCAVLQPGGAVLYWALSANATSTTGADGGVTSDKGVVGATEGNGGFLTFGVVMRASGADGGALEDAATGFNTSFFALGLSAEGQGMKGMDVALLRRDGEKWALEDRWAVDYAMPTLDASQDKVLLSAGVVQGAPEVVAWSFQMPVANCGWVGGFWVVCFEGAGGGREGTKTPTSNNRPPTVGSNTHPNTDTPPNQPYRTTTHATRQNTPPKQTTQPQTNRDPKEDAPIRDSPTQSLPPPKKQTQGP